MSSRRKKISEKRVIANAFKQVDKIVAKSDKESEKFLKALNEWKKAGSAVLGVRIAMPNMVAEIATNIPLKSDCTDFFARVFAAMLLRVSSDLKIGVDGFLGDVAKHLSKTTEDLLSGKLMSRVKEEEIGKEEVRD